MTAMQRTKGKVGEREIAALIREHTGWDVRRRVRQHRNDSDLDGIPGWIAEVKRHKAAAPAEKAAWWAQAAAQAGNTPGALPVVFFRLDRHPWRVLWPLSAALAAGELAIRADYTYSVESSVEAWAAVARERKMAKMAEVLGF